MSITNLSIQMEKKTNSHPPFRQRSIFADKLSINTVIQSAD